MPRAHGGQKKASYSLELELNGGEPPYGHWELNPGHLQEPSALNC